MMRDEVGGWLVLLALVASGCDQGAGAALAIDASATVRDAGLVPAPSRCGARDQAPLRDSDGRMTCVQVGAHFKAPMGEWPDAGDAGVPSTSVRYVRAGAEEMGADGSREHPFADPAVALASLPAEGGTVVIARGHYEVPSPLAPRGSVAMVGAGPSSDEGTAFEAGAATVVRVSGTTTRLTLRGLTLRHTAGGDAGVPVPSIAVEGGATLLAENVEVVRPGIGLQASGGARVTARGLSVLEAEGHGVLAIEGSRCDLRDVLVREGRGRGIEMRESLLQLHRALVHENAGIGVALRGTTAPDPAGGAARCTLDGPSEESGVLTCLSYASITCNGIAGVIVQGQVRATGLRLVLSGTNAVGSPPVGDGLIVQGGASFDLDPDVSAMGAGSELVGNGRVGVVVQNSGSRLSMRGAVVSGNASVGLFVADLAVVTSVIASEFAFNTAVGVAVATSTELMELRDSTIRDTRMGRLPAGSEMIGDGLSAGNASLRVVSNNELSGHPRYAGLFGDTAGTLRSNRGSHNTFTLYSYGSPDLHIEESNHVDGARGTGMPEVPRGSPPSPLSM